MQIEGVHLFVLNFRVSLSEAISSPEGLITVSWQITGEHFLSAIRIWLYFSSHWDQWVTQFNFSWSPRSSLTLQKASLPDTFRQRDYQSAVSVRMSMHWPVWFFTPFSALPGEYPVIRLRDSCLSRLTFQLGHWSWQSNLSHTEWVRIHDVCLPPPTVSINFMSDIE